jgi:hypothetical protein
VRCLGLIPWYVAIRKSWFAKHYPSDDHRGEIMGIYNWTHISMVVHQVGCALMILALALSDDACGSVERNTCTNEVHAKTLPEYTGIVMNLLGAPIIFQLTMPVHTFGHILFSWTFGVAVVIVLVHNKEMTYNTVMTSIPGFILMYAIENLYMDAFDALSNNISDYYPVSSREHGNLGQSVVCKGAYNDDEPATSSSSCSGGNQGSQLAPGNSSRSTTTSFVGSRQQYESKVRSYGSVSDAVVATGSDQSGHTGVDTPSVKPLAPVFNLAEKCAEMKNYYYRGPSVLTLLPPPPVQSQSISEVSMLSDLTGGSEMECFAMSPNDEFEHYQAIN